MQVYRYAVYESIMNINKAFHKYLPRSTLIWDKPPSPQAYPRMSTYLLASLLKVPTYLA